MPKLNSLTLALLGSLSYLGTTVALLQPGAIFPPPPVVEEAETHIIGENHDASWNYENPEIDRLIVDLSIQRKALEKRQGELDAWAGRLKNERHDLVKQLQADFDKTVLYVGKNEEANLKKMAKVYTAMTPKSAMTILTQFDDDQLVRFISFMKETETAPLLEALMKEGPEGIHRAAMLAERLRLTMQDAPTGANQ
jgi:flagellar motility protein MotE (MotC chaperone)